MGEDDLADEDELAVVTHTTDRRLHWPVWASSVDDLAVVVRTFRQLATRGHHADLLLIESNKPKSDLQKRAIDENWELRASATYPTLRQTVKGPPEKILEQLDAKAVEVLEIATETDRNHNGSMRVTFRRSESKWYEDRWGVELYLQSRDYGWVQEASNGLSVAIKRGVPWWAFLRARHASWLYGFVAGSAVVIATVRHLGGVAFWLGEGSGMVVGVASSWPIRKWFPAFEVLGPRSRARGAIGVAILGSLTAQLVIGLIVSILVH